MRPPGFWFDAAPGAVVAALTPVSWLFRAGAALRRARTKSVKVPVPVICIGNVTLGGAGKTPVAIDLGRRMTAAGCRPHFLTRGHGGRAKGPLLVDPGSHTAREVGDEPLLLARVAPTWVARDRTAGAKAAAGAGASHIVMDDGYQNPSLHKDVNLLVVDGEIGIGNGQVFPAGPLRETAEAAIARADAVAVLGGRWADALPAEAGPLVLRADIVPTRPEALAPGTACIAFAGIARPSKLFATLDALDLAVLHKASYPDHYGYTDRDIAGLRSVARDVGAVLVTTEKDWVRLPPAVRQDIFAVPISLHWADRSNPLAAILEALTR